MPPKSAPQPSEADRAMFAEWMAKVKYLSQKDPGPFVIRRLTKAEFGNTVRDLFGVDPSVADGLPDEVSGEGYLNSLSALQLEQYLKIAEKVVAQNRLLPAAPKGDARGVARWLANKAYRRPATEAELDVLVATYHLGRRSNLDAQRRVVSGAGLQRPAPFEHASQQRSGEGK